MIARQVYLILAKNSNALFKTVKILNFSDSVMSFISKNKILFKYNGDFLPMMDMAKVETLKIFTVLNQALAYCF